MTAMPGVDDLPRILTAFLSGNPTLSLATVDQNGFPHAANVNFVADESLGLYFLSSPDSAHSQHVESRPVVAATCYAPFEGPEDIRGVQIHGTCSRCAFDPAWGLFLAKFPYAAAFEAMARREEQFYRLRPNWMRWIDNSVRFGFKLASDWPLPEA